MPPKKNRASTSTRTAPAARLRPAPRDEPAPAVASPPETVLDDDASEELLDQLTAELDPLTELQRRYFTRQQPEDRAIELGSRTSATLYTRAALRVYVQISAAAEKHPKVFVGFTPTLRRWFLDQLVALRSAVDLRSNRAKDGGAVSIELQEAMTPARRARNAVLAPLELVVEGFTEDEKKLALSRGDTTTPAALVQSLRALAGLGESVLARTGDLAEIALAESGLQSHHVRDARAAAEALQKAIDADTRIGRKERADRDTPTMNILEGRATLSLRRARKIYAQARVLDRALPALQIPKALERVLGTPASVGKKNAAPAKPAPAPDA